MTLSEAQIWASELKTSLYVRWNYNSVPLLAFSEDALHHGFSRPGSVNEKIQAVTDYQKSHPSAAMQDRKYMTYSNITAPNRIVNELLEALKGNLDYMEAAKSSYDHDISTLSPEVELLAAQTFMFRNKHDNTSDEEALKVFRKAIQYLKGEQSTSTEFIKCKSSELTEIIRCVNQHFFDESIDVNGHRIVKRLMESINQGTEPPKPDGFVYSWDLCLLSKVDDLSYIYREREEIFKNQSNDYILSEWGREGQNFNRWYIFCTHGEYSGKEYYAMKFTKAVTISGIVREFGVDFRANGDPAILKQFQNAKVNGYIDSEFQNSSAYRWSKDGTPPAHPYFIVAQLYWPHFVRDLNYLLAQNKHQVTDKEALTVLYDEIPTLKEHKEKSDPTFKTYTWFVNKPSNAVNDFPELKDYSEGQTFSEDYLRPSTEPLQTDGFSYEWSREEHGCDHQDFTLIFRARPTSERVPQVITEENRIRLDYWQYVKEFVFFGGSLQEGTVLAPDPVWIDEAHRNGVGIFGTVFLPTLTDGGNVNDTEELAKLETLQKLVDIAHQLNFEGWFLNVESFRDYSEPALYKLKESLKQVDLRGKKMIWYVPKSDLINRFDPASEGVKIACDDKINNVASAFLEEDRKKMYLNFYHLYHNVFGKRDPMNYLMYVDEPFWSNTVKDKGYLVKPSRFHHAQNCLWQFFLGENGLHGKPTDQYQWYGIAKYAKQRKQLGKE